MSSRWFWKPVMVGAIIFTLLGCIFIGWLLVVLTCPGLRWTCLSSTQTIFIDLLSIGLPTILIGVLIGAVLGALFAVIRKRVRGKEEEARQSE